VWTEVKACALSYSLSLVLQSTVCTVLSFRWLGKTLSQLAWHGTCK
jgi:hypothetical protein